MCNFEACHNCHCKDCMTGQIAREQGRAAYEEHLKMMDAAEELLNATYDDEE